MRFYPKICPHSLKSQKYFSKNPFLKAKWPSWVKSGECTSLAAAAKQLGISIRTVDRIMKVYRESGLEPLSRPDRQRRFSKLITPETHKQLEIKLNDSETPLKGYWHAQQWLSEELGIDIAYHTLRSYLIKHFGTKLKAPRKSHYKSDNQAKEAFLKTPKHIQ